MPTAGKSPATLSSPRFIARLAHRCPASSQGGLQTFKLCRCCSLCWENHSILLPSPNLVPTLTAFQRPQAGCLLGKPPWAPVFAPKVQPPLLSFPWTWHAHTSGSSLVVLWFAISVSVQLTEEAGRLSQTLERPSLNTYSGPGPWNYTDLGFKPSVAI